jgi:hypothetical protein
MPSDHHVALRAQLSPIMLMPTSILTAMLGIWNNLQDYFYARDTPTLDRFFPIKNEQKSLKKSYKRVFFAHFRPYLIFFLFFTVISANLLNFHLICG